MLRHELRRSGFAGRNVGRIGVAGAGRGGHPRRGGDAADRARRAAGAA